MIRRLRAALPLALALALLLAACSPAAPNPPVASTTPPTAAPTQPPTTAPTTVPTTVPTAAPTAGPTVQPTGSALTLTDGLSRTMTLGGPAKRIVSLAPSNTEILFAIGAGPQVVGRDELSDYPPEAKSVTSIGQTFQKLNTEAIVALKPDLVLASSLTPPEQVKAMEDLGLKVFLLANPPNFDGLYANLATVGTLTGHQADAAKLVTSLQQRVAAVEDKIKGASTQPKVYYELDGTDPTKPWTTGPGTFIDRVIIMSGGQNVGAGLKDQFAQISSEELIKQNPDIIILGDSKFGISVASIGQRPGWDKLTAVQKSRIYPFDDDLVSRPGPRLVDGLETMAKLIHPELFQ